ncbi:MAG: FHA domain-containing protein [Anaerolineaceae bacterium]|nr:FHA domain-containing protein [Anaerolineaceae bacterium]
MSAEDSHICPVCHRQNKPDATQCAYCGETLQAPVTIIIPEQLTGETVQEHLDFLLHRYYDGLVLIIAGQKQPVVLKNMKKVILGRQAESSGVSAFDLTPYGASSLGVSRQHAVIKAQDNGHYALEDMNSTNGTFVNETRLQPYTSHTLYNGDLVRLGQLILFVYYQSRQGQPRVLEQYMTLVVNPLLPEGMISPSGLTMTRLTNDLTPFLHALAELQYSIDTVRDKRVVEIRILSLTSDTAQITVGLSGALDAVLLLRDVILPWRRKNGVGSLRDASQMESRPEDSAGQETLEFPAQHTSAIQDDESTLSPEALAGQIQAIMEHFEAELVPAALAQIGGQLSASEEDAYRNRLIPHLRILSTSSLEISPE